MDELGSGTDPSQGVAIAQAVLESLLETGSRVAITTHYVELKNLASSDPRFMVGAMQFIHGKPTYKLLPGAIGESFALAVAERLELPSHVITRANELLDQETRQMGDLIRNLEDQKALADKALEELEEKKQQIEALEESLQAEKEKLEEKMLTARRDEAEKFAKKLEEKEATLEDVLKRLKNDPSRKIVADSWDDIKVLKRAARAEAENIPNRITPIKAPERQLVPLTELPKLPKLKVGDTLTVCNNGPFHGTTGPIMQIGRTQVNIKILGIVSQFAYAELSLPLEAPTRKRKRNLKQSYKTKSARSVEKLLKEEGYSREQSKTEWKNEESQAPAASQPAAIVRTTSNTLDVRGFTGEQAVDESYFFFK
mmetsp:Transcript_2727/g.3951  ORF Transcript_2727/g.3951 Transcript_2727/m.3951 type:complete len:369 (+) Transcript_2727:1-1107(+)